MGLSIRLPSDAHQDSPKPVTKERERELEREPKRERERHYYLLVPRPESLTIKSALFYLFDVRP